MTENETETGLPGEATIRTWARMARIQTLALEEIHQALKSAGLPALTWYDVLYELYKAGAEGLRQFEVGEKTLITKYNLSRLVGKLKQEGMVDIAACPEDGRGNSIIITDQGKTLLKRMWPVYGAVVKQRIETRLSASEIQDLYRLLEKLEYRYDGSMIRPRSRSRTT